MKYFFTSVWCSLTIIFTAHCMQNPVNNGTVTAILPEQQYFIFHAPNYENKFGIIPSTLSSTDSLLRIFQTNEQNNAIVELLPLQEQNNQIATKVTSNNNATIFITNNNFFAYRTQKNNIHNTITPLDPAQGLP